MEGAALMDGASKSIKAAATAEFLQRDDELLLRDALERGLRSHFGIGCQIESIRRAPSAYRSSFSIEQLDVCCFGRRTLQVVFKDLSPAEMPELTRQAKPSFLYDPLREMDKLHDLYDSLVEARRAVGEDAVPFHKFADLVKTQVKKLKTVGSGEVAFRVAVKDGKVNFTARAMKGGSEKS